MGDGCFAEITSQGIVLTTENGIEETNRIVLEPETWSGVLAYVASAKEVELDFVASAKDVDG